MANNGTGQGARPTNKANATAPATGTGWTFTADGTTATNPAGIKRRLRGDTDVPIEELGLVDFTAGDVTGPAAWPPETWASLVANDAVSPFPFPAVDTPPEPDDDAGADAPDGEA